MTFGQFFRSNCWNVSIRTLFISLLLLSKKLLKYSLCSSFSNEFFFISTAKLPFLLPVILGIDFLISEKVVDIISAYKLPIHNKIPVKIDTFDEKYFLIGFPIWSSKVLDFQKSTFYYQDRDVFSFSNYEDYENFDSEYGDTTKIDLYLRNKIEYDIISIDEAIFFSEEIVEELKENNATGYRIVDGILNI